MRLHLPRLCGAASLIPARGGFASPEPVFVPRAFHSAVLRYNPAAGTRERLMRPWPFVVAFFLSPILVFAADQQQPAVPSVGEVIEVSIVNLDVVVTDKRGKRVAEQSLARPLHAPDHR